MTKFSGHELERLSKQVADISNAKRAHIASLVGKPVSETFCEESDNLDAAARALLRCARERQHWNNEEGIWEELLTPEPPPADQIEAAQVLYEGMFPNWSIPWAKMTVLQKDAYRRGVAALRPVTGVAPEGMRDRLERTFRNIVMSAMSSSAAHGGWDVNAENDAVNAILAALPPASGSDHGPVGWRLVPEEPTREMWAAMGDALMGYRNRHHDKVAGQLWNDVLAAAPPPPTGDK